MFQELDSSDAESKSVTKTSDTK